MRISLRLVQLVTFCLWLILPNSVLHGEALQICHGNFTVRDLVEDANGTIWAGTFGMGLWKISGGSAQLFVSQPPGQLFPMICNLLLDGNLLWIATAGGGCLGFDLNRQAFLPIKQNANFNKLHGLFKTSSGHLLIGSVGTGTAILDNNEWKPISPRTLQHLSWVNDINEWNDRIWLATSAGLYHTDLKKLTENWHPISAYLGEGANFIYPDGNEMLIGTTARGVFRLRPGKQPAPVRNTYGEIYFITRFKNHLIAGGRYGLWEINATAAREISNFPDLVAKTFLVTKNNTLLVGTEDGKIIETEDLRGFKILLNLQQHGLEEPNDAE